VLGLSDEDGAVADAVDPSPLVLELEVEGGVVVEGAGVDAGVEPTVDRALGAEPPPAVVDEVGV
jgi:hypothetical protein